MELSDLQDLPRKPGVYLWKNKHGQIIYVGKAKVLRDRMKQYFKGMQNSYKTQRLVELIDSYEYVITNTEKEALILERNLIEKHAPEFNILLTDDKRYPYLKLALRDRLEISLVYRVKSERARAFYFGPFPTGFGARRMLNLISRLVLYEKGLPIKTASPEFWRARFDEAKQLLGAGTATLLRRLNAEMTTAAENMQYEIAHDLHESIQALEFYAVKQAVELQDTRDIDVVAFFEKDHYLSVAMLFYRGGALLSKRELVVEITSDAPETARQLLSLYYAYNIRPKLLVTNLPIETDLETVVPQKGQLKRLLTIALQNAQDNVELKLREFVRKEELTLGALKELGALIGLPQVSHIMLVDNSNTSNTEPVSVFVSYRNGIKIPGEYRKYRVEANARLADVDYMAQGVTKYFASENNVHPDLLIVDGGVAQINAVRDLVGTVPVIGLVKNDNHVTDALINLRGERVALQPGNLLNFLRGMQEEVDRYAKTYHHRRRQTTLEGKLISVPGVGPRMEAKLLEHFKNYAAIYNASLADLTQIVPARIAASIKAELGKE